METRGDPAATAELIEAARGGDRDARIANPRGT
jgi:hypothetical protein